MAKDSYSPIDQAKLSLFLNHQSPHEIVGQPGSLNLGGRLFWMIALTCLDKNAFLYIKLTLNNIKIFQKFSVWWNLLYGIQKRNVHFNLLKHFKDLKILIHFFRGNQPLGKGARIGHLSISLDLGSRTSSLLFILEDSSCVLLLGISFSMIFPLRWVVTDLA